MRLNIRAVKKADSILFLTKNRYETLEEYYVKSARVERSRELCDEPVTSQQLKWQLSFNENSAPATQAIIFKKGVAVLNKDTIYLVKLMISKSDNSRRGYGTGVFVISSNGDLLTASTYPEIQKLCAQAR